MIDVFILFDNLSENFHRLDSEILFGKAVHERICAHGFNTAQIHGFGRIRCFKRKCGYSISIACATTEFVAWFKPRVCVPLWLFGSCYALQVCIIRESIISRVCHFLELLNITVLKNRVWEHFSHNILLLSSEDRDFWHFSRCFD
jgi:hypothetical protein